MPGKIGAHSLVTLTMVNGDGKPRTYVHALCGNYLESRALEKKKVFPEGTAIGHIGADIAQYILGKSAGDTIEDAELRCGKARITIDAVDHFPVEALEALQPT